MGGPDPSRSGGEGVKAAAAGACKNFDRRPRDALITGEVVGVRVFAAVCAKGAGVVRAGVLGAAAFSLTFLLLAVAPGLAQAPLSAAPPPPLPGFVPPYEVSKTVRAAGFTPLAPPMREGTTYVLRATDFRGILMRVVVDARSGAIRAVNRIVPPSGSYGPVGMMSPYGEPPPYMPPPYRVPPPYGVPAAYASPDIDGPTVEPQGADLRQAGLGQSDLAAPPSAIRATATRPFEAGPPLPRPRPAELAARDAQAAAKTTDKTSDKTTDMPAETRAVKPEAKPNAAAIAPAAVPVAPAVSKKPPAPQLPD